MAKTFREQVEENAAQVLSRMDEKGESLNEAIEAVLGTVRGRLASSVRRCLQGQSY